MPLSIERAVKRQLFKFLAPLFRNVPSDPPLKAPQARRVLLVRQDNRIGNQIFLLPLAQMIRERLPGVFLGLLAGGRYPELLAGAGRFDALHCYDQLGFIRRPWAFPRFLSELRRTRYDVAVDAKRDFSFNNSLMTFLSGAAARIGFRHPETAGLFDFEAPPPPGPLYEADALAQLFSFFGPVGTVPPPSLSLAEDQREPARAELAALGVPVGRPIVGIHPGGRGGKRWPLENVGSLCRLLDAREDLFRVIFLGPDEKDAARLFQDERRQRVVLPRDASILAGMTECCTVVVCNDTGILHLAAALGIPTVSVFLTSSPRRYAPRGDKHAVLDGTGGQGVGVERVKEEVLRRLA